MELDEAFALEKVLITTVNSQIATFYVSITRVFHMRKVTTLDCPKAQKEQEKKRTTQSYQTTSAGNKNLKKTVLEKKTDKTVQFELVIQIKRSSSFKILTKLLTKIADW